MPVPVLTALRCLYMEKLSSKLSRAGGGGGGGDSMEMEEVKFDDMMSRERVMLSLRIAESACQQVMSSLLSVYLIYALS